jgi:hypothetical protein
VQTTPWTYYGVQWGIVALGGLAWLRDRNRAPVPEGAARTVDRAADVSVASTPAPSRRTRARRGKPDVEEIPAALPSSTARVPNADPR